jgi:hypothetical protein
MILIAAWFTVYPAWKIPGLHCAGPDRPKDEDISIGYWEKTCSFDHNTQRWMVYTVSIPGL